MNEKRRNQYNTLKEEADRIGVPVSWLYNQLTKKGADKIPCFKRGKYWFFIPEKTDEWIEAGKQ